MLMPLYHGFIDLKRIAVYSEKLSPSAENKKLYILVQQSNLLYQLFGLVFGDYFWFSVDTIHFKLSKSV